MKKMQTFGLVGLLASTAFTATDGVEREQLGNWRNAVTTNDFKKTLVNIKSLQGDWPAIHSVKHTVNGDEDKALVQTGYRDVAKTFLQGLESYEKTLREMPPEAFCEGAEVLLKVRERFLKHPSYVNYFLVDSINRVIYVNLGERLAKVGDLPVVYDKIVERLAESRCDLPQIITLVNGEYDANLISMAMVKDSPLTHPLQVIGKEIGQVNFFFIPEDVHNLYNLRILEKRSLTALLNRLVWSEHFIGASLPALLSYRRKAAQFTPADSSLQIRSVLGDEVWLPPTLWHGRPNAAGMVSDFLDAMRSENWRQATLCFSDSPNFTEEVIETLEKQEAEREAKKIR